MKKIVLAIAVLLLVGCGEKEIETYTSMDGSGEKIVYNKTTDEVLEVQETKETPVAVVEVDGATLYTKRCASCHGIDGKKSALNASAIIAGLSKEELNKRLNGYKDGSYGGTMKSAMRAQAMGLKEDEQAKVVAYISGL